MTRRRVWALAFFGLLLVLGGAGAWWLNKQNLAAATSPATSAAAAAANRAPAAGQAIELAPGDVAVAQRAELVSTLQVSGSLKARDSAMIKARIAAEVKTLAVREGDRVTAGQRLGQLDSTEATLRLRQAEEQALAAQAQLDIAQRTLDNNKALVNQGFISRNALDTSSSSAAGAQASLLAARAAAELARKAVADGTIRAPIAGLVAQRLVQPGERVGVDARLLEIVDLSHIELEASVSPEDVLALRVGQLAQVQIDGLAAAVPARVLRINPSTQAGSRSVLAYLQLMPNSDASQGASLRQGLFARANIDLTRRPALVVPASALRVDQAQPYLLTVERGLVVQRTVGVGGRGNVNFNGAPEPAIEITRGLVEGAAVLLGSVGTLREGTRLTLPANGPKKLPVLATSSAPSTAASSAANPASP